MALPKWSVEIPYFPSIAVPEENVCGNSISSLWVFDLQTPCAIRGLRNHASHAESQSQ
jgi:hypothetical protein